MDWSKVKNILIILFVFLNIFLLFNIIRAGMGGRVSNETIENTKKILAEKKVIIKCEIPAFNRKMGSPEYEEGVIKRLKVVDRLIGNIPISLDSTKDGNIIKNGTRKLVFSENSFIYENSNPEGSVDITHCDNAVKCIKEKLAGTELPLSDFKQDTAFEINNGEIVVILREKSDRMIIFDNRIKACINSKGIKYIKCTYRKLENITQPRSVIPVYQILLRNYYSAGIVITNIDFGYKMYKMDKETKGYVDGPVWRIITEDGNARFFKAYDGEEVGQEL